MGSKKIFKGNIVVGQSGGPTAVINATVAGVYTAAKEEGVEKVYGMVHGVEGFLEKNLIRLEEYLDTGLGIELLKRTPAAFLGSCRYKLPLAEDKPE
ncbi:6-phosphofructokinase, partial [Lachnospiraceae bacterium OttesenSCG-928-D06]|nr:6-phosphofructokinase [Lachnospiraceae bacterium OttesenSCG-928-D06]